MKRYVLTHTFEEANYLDVWNRANNERKALDVLAGLCLGILADGETNSRETKFLLHWLKQNQRLLPPIICRKLIPLLEVLSDDSQSNHGNLSEFSTILGQVVGSSFEEITEIPPNSNPACGLIFDTICPRPCLKTSD